MVCFEAKENNIKSFAKSGLANIGALVNSTLVSSKDFLALGVHFISLLYLSMLVICFMISARLGMNLLRKLLSPEKIALLFFFWVCQFLGFPQPC
jgi:hypothetical protein